MISNTFTSAVFAGFLLPDFQTEDGQPFVFYRSGDIILAPDPDHTGSFVAGFSISPALSQKDLITVQHQNLILVQQQNLVFVQHQNLVLVPNEDIRLAVGDPMPAACDFGNGVYAYGRSHIELQEIVAEAIRSADIRLPADPRQLGRVARLGNDPDLLRRALEARLAAHETDHLPLPVFRQHEIRASLIQPLIKHLGLPPTDSKATNIASALTIDVAGASCRILATTKLFRKLAGLRPEIDPLFKATMDAFSLTFAGIVDSGKTSPAGGTPIAA